MYSIDYKEKEGGHIFITDESQYASPLKPSQSSLSSIPKFAVNNARRKLNCSMTKT